LPASGGIGRRDIALSLSGGGFRATCFHLGVLKKLHELGLLERVGLISSVSGGSILAGLYATSLVNHESFDEFLCDAHAFVTQGWSLDWPAMLHDFLPWSKSSRGLERRYRRAFKYRDGRPIMLRDLEGLPPLLVFNATAVHSGAGWRFLSGGKADHWDLGFTHSRAFETRFTRYHCDVPLSVAVAASSAFPTFTAVTIPREQLQETGERSVPDPEVASVVALLNPVLPDPVALSDGGVLDNLGITSIMAGMSPPESPTSFYLIASDAGAMIKQLRSPPTGRFRKLRYVMRQFDMRGGHNEDMTQFLALIHYRSVKPMGLAMFRIQRAVPHAGETLDQVRDLATIRTRLEPLPEDKYDALLRHGGNLVWTRLTEYTDLLPPEREMPGAVKRRRVEPAGE